MESLLELLNTPAGIIGSLTTILVGLLAFLRSGRKALRAIWHWLTRLRPKVPKESIRILPIRNRNWWHMGAVDKRPAMQISALFHATNITEKPIRVLDGYIKKPRTEAQYVFTRHPERNVFGSYPILPDHTSEVSISFWIQPPVRKEGEDLTATVVLVDQFGNKHKARNVIFKGPRLKEPDVKPAGEALHSLSDPLEKEVAAVLKAEVTRYEQCGRRVGGLGSVQTTYRNQTMRGIGTEWRDADSPKNQSIVTDPEAARFDSDNAEALLRLYGRLTTPEDQATFMNSLLERLSRSTEYAPVGYLILLVLHRINKRREALHAAKKNLQNDEAYGFSDFLRLLDGLLRFDHPSFTEDDLDEIERSLEGIEEHTFGIQERLVAIRAYRLRGTENGATSINSS